jgi:hypothetical protein
MYAACSFVVGTVWPSGGVTSFARIWIWAAVAVWAIVFVALVKQAVGAVQGARGRTESLSERPS